MSGHARAIAYTIRECKLGRLLVAATPRGVCQVRFGGADAALARELEREFPWAELRRDDAELEPWAGALVRAVDEGGDPGPVPLDVSGSRFQWRVWEALRRIPRGATRTYGELAASLGRPRAARAVARACATNPVPVLVPCHRVVPAAGGVGGYAYGADRKQALLEAEARPAGHHPPKSRAPAPESALAGV